MNGSPECQSQESVPTVSQPDGIVQEEQRLIPDNSVPIVWMAVKKETWKRLNGKYHGNILFRDHTEKPVPHDNPKVLDNFDKVLNIAMDIMFTSTFKMVRKGTVHTYYVRELVNNPTATSLDEFLSQTSKVNSLQELSTMVKDTVFKCSVCGMTDNAYLQLHRKDKEQGYVIGNLELICLKCHRHRHDKVEDFTKDKILNLIINHRNGENTKAILHSGALVHRHKSTRFGL